jgi:F0F1-type ATP synthase membrane subunit b/b'
MFLSFIISNALIAFAGAEEMRWWDYPGFELWKFINLAIFVAALVYIMTRKAKLGEAFKARSETIKQELTRAQRERDAALAKLKDVEQRLANIDSEVVAIKDHAVREAAEERARIASETQNEITRLSGQARREIENAGKAAKKELRLYTAEQSVRLAEEIVRREMKPEDEARLIANNIEELGGSAQ